MTAKPVHPPYGELWKVARVNVNAEPITDEQRTELFAWLDALGVPYRECRPDLVITKNAEDGRLLLHLTRFALDGKGDKYVDHAANRVHTTPYVVEIAEYPAWLVQASTTQDQLKEI